MIVRTGRRIPGIVPFGGVHAPISVVRMAVGDAYGAKEWREGEGDDEAAFRTERIERRICHSVAEFAFRLAEDTGAKVFGGPKFTVSPVYEGMLKEEMDAAAERHPEVTYEPQLIDATFALLIAASGDPLVIPALNRDGDILSDLVLPLFGSIAGSESLLVGFGDDFEPTVVLAEAAHGTAPSLQGKNVANPMAMILAARGGARLRAGTAHEAARAIREACLEAVAAGVRTADLGGDAGTSEFTDEVIRRTKLKLRLGGRGRGQLGLGEELEEDARDLRVELRAGAALDLGQRLVTAQRRPVGPVARHRVERVGDGEHARLERDLLAGLAGRIAVPVPALVVVEHVRDRLAQGRHAQQDPRADLRVLADLRELVVVEPALLAQHLVGDRELADVVQRAADAQRSRAVPRSSRAGARPPRRARSRARSVRVCTDHAPRSPRSAPTASPRCGSFNGRRADPFSRPRGQTPDSGDRASRARSGRAAAGRSPPRSCAAARSG